MRVHGQRLGHEAHGAYDRHQPNVSADFHGCRTNSSRPIPATANSRGKVATASTRELVRDNALSISGLLSPKIGGPSVRPYQPAKYWDNLNFPPRDYVADQGESEYRRGLYTWRQRTFPHPSLIAFDASSREACTAERTRSNIPQQALVLLNDPTYVEAARVFAARIFSECHGTTDERITWAWQQNFAAQSQRTTKCTPCKICSKSRLGEYHSERGFR